MKRAAMMVVYVLACFVSVTVGIMILKFGWRFPHAWETSSESERATLLLMSGSAVAMAIASGLAARTLGQKIRS